MLITDLFEPYTLVPAVSFCCSASARDHFLSHLVRFFMAELGTCVLGASQYKLILFALAARLMALKAQDRVIRLEESFDIAICFRRVAAKASALPASQIIALRFASDGELASLVERSSREFAKTKDIKMAIKDWRGDYLRVDLRISRRRIS